MVVFICQYNDFEVTSIVNVQANTLLRFVCYVGLV